MKNTDMTPPLVVFIVFDVVNYYPSITLELLTKALAWAKTHVDITEEEIEIIKETKKSLLFMNKEAWTKKGDLNFDVAQGGFDSAEVCDLVGLFLLAELRKEKLDLNAGVFRDDGLGVSSAKPRVVDQMKKKICAVYKKHGLGLTVDANKKVVHVFTWRKDDIFRQRRLSIHHVLCIMHYISCIILMHHALVSCIKKSPPS